jgi:cytidine deaminase
MVAMQSPLDLEPELVERMIQTAEAARGNAYAPYSRYSVGAALVTTDGRIFSGCNVENASYGLSVCAERNALAAAVAAGARELAALVVLTDSSPPAAPCGACRQVLAEFGEFHVLLVNARGERIATTVDELQPRPFRGSQPTTS